MFLRTSKEPFDNRKQLWISVTILVLMLLVGAVGFYWLSEKLTFFECVYLAALILTTVGMKENGVDLNAAQQGWALIIMLVGISAALYAASNLVAFIIDGEIRRIFGRRQLQSKIDRMKDHYIVCGFGRMGKALCAKLNEKGTPFILIDQNAPRAQEADALGYTYLNGDAMSEHTLQAARIHAARGLATCLHSDADNVFVTLTARGLNDKLTIIARAEEIEAQPKLQRAGADRVICPPVLGANQVMHMLLSPGIDELLELAVTGPDLEISKIRVAQLPKAVDRPLRQLAPPNETGLMVVALVRPDGTRQFNPPPNTLLKQDDEIIVVAQAGGVEKMVQILSEPL